MTRKKKKQNPLSLTNPKQYTGHNDTTKWAVQLKRSQKQGVFCVVDTVEPQSFIMQ